VENPGPPLRGLALSHAASASTLARPRSRRQAGKARVQVHRPARTTTASAFTSRPARPANRSPDGSRIRKPYGRSSSNQGRHLRRYARNGERTGHALFCLITAESAGGSCRP
jgi:hypothetical protein